MRRFAPLQLLISWEGGHPARLTVAIQKLTDKKRRHAKSRLSTGGWPAAERCIRLPGAKLAALP
jgi:hypothetical protein